MEQLTSDPVIHLDDDKPKKSEAVNAKTGEGSIEGQVSCSEGPVRNATVSFGGIEVHTNSVGGFLLEHLPIGIGKLEVKSSMKKFNDFGQDVVVEQARRKSLFIHLTQATGKISGIVTDEKGVPMIGVEISGIFNATSAAVSTKTDDDGHYLFEEVPPGGHYLRAKASGRTIEQAIVNVVGGNTSEFNLKLSTGTLSISGKVMRRKDTVGLASVIYLMRAGTLVSTMETKPNDGKYAFHNLTSGSHQLSVNCRGYAPRAWWGDLKKSEVVDFKLDEAMGR